MRSSKENTATVSVIVPVYNTEKYIHRCVDSIRAQTYSDLEIILVDDASPDACPEICDGYADSDSRVRALHKPNEGLGAARNTGLDACRGEYVMFVDSDDYLCTDAVCSLYERLTADGSDIAVGAHVDVYDDGETNGRYCAFMKDTVLSRDEYFREMGSYSVSAWGKLYRREVLDGIRYPSLRYAEDMYVFPEVIGRCERISVLSETVYCYFQNMDSITHKKEASAMPDEIEGLLHVSHILLDRGYAESALHYYEKAINKALLLRNGAAGRELFRTHLTRAERKQLRTSSSKKTRVKYALLHIPLAPALFRRVKGK